MIDPKLVARLRSFRRELYDALGLRQDSLFELMDAVLSAPERRPLVRLSLCPCFRRRWSSTCDALADGSLDVKTLRALFQAQVPLPAPGERPVWAVDGTHWPRPAAATSAARTWEYRPLPGKPQQGVVPAWAYHWLVQVPEPEGSWVLPLDVQPRGPTAETPTQVAIHQIAQARARQAAETPRPVVALDSAHEVGSRPGGALGQEPRLPPRAAAVLWPWSTAHTWPGLQAPGRQHPWPSRPLGQPGAPGVRDRDGRGLDRPARPGCARCSIHRRVRAGRAPAAAWPTDAAVAGLDWGRLAGGPAPGLALVPQALHGRAPPATTP